MLQFERWKIIMILLICVAGIAYSMPNFFPRDSLQNVPSWLPNKQINLGLDLRGGSYLLLQVEVDALIKERLEAVVADTRDALREARIGYTGLGIQDGHVTVRIRDPENVKPAIERLKDLSVLVSTTIFGRLPEQDLIISEEGQGRITLTISEAARLERTRSAVEQSIEIVRRRIDELGTTEPAIQRQGVDRILVQVPGLDNPQRLKELLGKTAKLNFRLVDVSIGAEQALATRVPSGSEVLYTTDEPSRPILVQKRIMVSGDSLVDAQATFDSQTSEPIVSFRFDSSGAKKFGKVTQENVGRPFAIVLDGEVISAPVIRDAILGGSGQISGSFTVEEANNLAILLRAGALPAPLTILEERTVGPGLGADSVAAGEIASVIGFTAVILFMIAVYGLFGVFANVALLINIMLILGSLSALQATLTLPGIAGVVLTIGMAVDANVLIFERIREEIRAGKPPIASITAGYSRALGTILDANITTLIAAAILFQMGSGPVRGFAVTLGIGIITSVFTAFTLNRLIVSVWFRWARPKVLHV